MADRYYDCLTFDIYYYCSGYYCDLFYCPIFYSNIYFPTYTKRIFSLCYNIKWINKSCSCPLCMETISQIGLDNSKQKN